MILHLYPTQRADYVTVVYQLGAETEDQAVLRAVRTGAIMQRPLDILTPLISDSTGRAMFEDIIVHRR